MKALKHPATLIALLALFVALGGTTYAATSLPKNSVGTKQLKKSAVTTAKIKNGAVTATKINTKGLTVPTAIHANSATSAANAANATHATSASNATNAAEATHATSATSATSASNATHATNADKLGGVGASSYEQFGASLPSGATETGAWGFGTERGADLGGAHGLPVFSFSAPLAAGLDGAHTIYVSGGSATHCSGPGHADAGYLCVYQGFALNVEPLVDGDIFNPEAAHGPAGSGRHGWSIFLIGAVAAPDSWFVGGSYAVTAP